MYWGMLQDLGRSMHAHTQTHTHTHKHKCTHTYTQKPVQQQNKSSRWQIHTVVVVQTFCSFTNMIFTEGIKGGWQWVVGFKIKSYSAGHRTGDSSWLCVRWAFWLQGLNICNPNFKKTGGINTHYTNKSPSIQLFIALSNYLKVLLAHAPCGLRLFLTSTILWTEVQKAPCHRGPQPSVMWIWVSQVTWARKDCRTSSWERCKMQALEKSHEVLSETRHRIGISCLCVGDWVDGWAGGWVGKWMDGWMDGGCFKQAWWHSKIRIFIIDQGMLIHFHEKGNSQDSCDLLYNS